MVKRTYKNFIRTMEILQNQAFMTAAEAERRTRQIFDSVEYDRQVRKVKSGVYSGHYVQISYDKNTGEILTDYHYSLGKNEWTVYDDLNVVTICYTSNKMTMQQIADAISEVVNDNDLDK